MQSKIPTTVLNRKPIPWIHLQNMDEEILMGEWGTPKQLQCKVFTQHLHVLTEPLYRVSPNIHTLAPPQVPGPCVELTQWLGEVTRVVRELPGPFAVEYSG